MFSQKRQLPRRCRGSFGFLGHALVGAKPAFEIVMPALPASLTKPKGGVEIVVAALKCAKFIKDVRDNGIENAAASACASSIFASAIKPVKKKIRIAALSSLRDRDGFFRINGMGGRNWIDPEIDSDCRGRIVKPMVIVFHDANRAGKHIDVHIGNLSLIYRVSGKDVEKEIVYNRNGALTQASKDALVAHVLDELNHHSRVPQNLDHSWVGAHESWLVGERGPSGYGAGATRQVVSESMAEIVDVGDNESTISVFAPAVAGDSIIYLHRLYPPNASRDAPILVAGIRRDDPGVLEDRLHLRLFNGRESMGKFLEFVDPKTVTVKEDGASVYFKIDEKRGRAWSPRTSTVTGKQIQYTGKLPEVARIKSDLNISGIGELVFFKGGRKLTAAEIGGILNSDSVRPVDVVPKIKIYRIDGYGGSRVSDLPFFENRKIQQRVAELCPIFDVVDLSKPKIKDGIEGYVGAPAGASINAGAKLKLWGDDNDWKVVGVDLKNGSTGRTAGVVRFVSMDSGKEFNLGPGQIGSEARVRQMMSSPDSFIGTVFKVKSRRGHEGRASKVVEPHPDK